MAARKRTYDEPQAILTGRTKSNLKEIDPQSYEGLASAIVGAILEGSAVYVSPGRYGSVTVKYYVDGDQYAETLNPGDDWLDLGESILETLYNKEAVARVRRLRGMQIAERVAETRKPAGRVQIPGE
jgi:hypothetical protein